MDLNPTSPGGQGDTSDAMPWGSVGGVGCEALYMLDPRDEMCYASRQVMICPGFSMRPGSKLRELPVAARQGQFAIGDEREREFLPEYGSGGAASRGSGDGRKNAAPGEQLSERAADRGSNDRGRGVGGRTFTMFHGTSWRSWQNIRRHGFKLRVSADGGPETAPRRSEW